MPDTEGQRSHQAQIASDISAEIASGALGPGEQLPSLADLAQRYGVSLVTARLAIGRLRQQGLVISRQGRGNFVRKRTEARRYGIDRYRRSVWGGSQPQALLDAEAASQGMSVTQDTEVAQVDAPPFVAQRLGIAEGTTVWVRRRVTVLDGEVNQSADSYFTLETGERAPAIVEGRGPGGHIARINALSPVVEIREEIVARMPAGPETERLRIPEGTPVLEVIRTYHTEDGPLDVAQFVIRSDMAVFDYRFPVPD